MVALASCITIEHEMYGNIPRANILNLSSAPPENMLNILRIVPDCSSKKFCKAFGSIPGTGIYVPILYTINAPIKKNKRCLSSVNLDISANDPPPVFIVFAIN